MYTCIDQSCFHQLMHTIIHACIVISSDICAIHAVYNNWLTSGSRYAGSAGNKFRGELSSSSSSGSSRISSSESSWISGATCGTTKC